MATLDAKARMFFLSVAIALVGCASTDAEPEDDEEGSDALYADKNAIHELDDIPVCWMNAKDEQAMGWVKDAVAKSWSAHAKIRFVGWQKCTPQNRSRSVRIQVEDTRAWSKLGTYAFRTPVDQPTMVLNFTFQKWSQSCKNKREHCIRALAIHEFGHALGFAHEQSRPDTPMTCDLEGARDDIGARGVLLTKYDPSSVMNYCSAKWINGGRLSSLDIEGVKKVYGPK